MAAMGQNLIGPVTITIPANIAANTADWATAMPPVTIQAIVKPDSTRGVPGLVIEAKVLVTIKDGGGKICGIFTSNTAPPAGINSLVKLYRGADVTKLLGQNCILKPGSYTLCVQFFSSPNGQPKAISEESCKQFTIGSFSPPQNVIPAEGKIFTKEEASQPVIFRWTPVLPRPKEDIIYKVRVVEISKGQTKAQALKENSPIEIKEVKNQTQTTFKLAKRYNGLVWDVEAVSAERVQGGGNPKSYGTSEATAFSMTSPECHLEFPKNVKDSFVVVCKDNLQTATTRTYNVCTWLYNKNNATANPLTVTNITSLIPGNVVSGTMFFFSIPAGGMQQVCFDITVPTAQAYIKVKAFSNYTGTGGDDCTSNPVSDSVWLPQCKCNTCDSANIKWEVQSQLYYDSAKTNNVLTLHNDITVNPLLKVVKLSTEVVDFYWYTEGDCKKCNNNDFYWGNIISGSIKDNGFVSQGTSVADENGVPLTSSHQLDFISNTPAGDGLSADTYLNISLPPQTQLSCCTDCFRFCIRYTITFMENGVCKTCSIVKCYETKRKHRKTGKQLQLNECGERVISKGDLQSDVSSPGLNKNNN
jgi:hypothetical protein